MKIKYLGGGWVSKSRTDSHIFRLTVGKAYEAIPTYDEDVSYKVIGDCGRVLFLEKEFFEVINENPRIEELEDALRNCKDFLHKLEDINVSLPAHIWKSANELEGRIKTLLKD